MEWKRIFARPPNWWQLFESFARMCCAIWCSWRASHFWNIKLAIKWEGETRFERTLKNKFMWLDILWAKFIWIHRLVHFTAIHETHKTRRRTRRQSQNWCQLKSNCAQFNQSISVNALELQLIEFLILALLLNFRQPNNTANVRQIQQQCQARKFIFLFTQMNRWPLCLFLHLISVSIVYVYQFQTFVRSFPLSSHCKHHTADQFHAHKQIAAGTACRKKTIAKQYARCWFDHFQCFFFSLASFSSSHRPEKSVKELV